MRDNERSLEVNPEKLNRTLSGASLRGKINCPSAKLYLQLSRPKIAEDANTVDYSSTRYLSV